MTRVGSLVLAGWLAAGCAAAPPTAGPARLAAPPSVECLAAIMQFVSDRTGRAVTLGADVFAAGDELVLTPTVQRDAEGRPLDGRRRAPQPEVFRLQLQSGQCVLLQPSTASWQRLPQCTCATPAR